MTTTTIHIAYYEKGRDNNYFTNLIIKYRNKNNLNKRDENGICTKKYITKLNSHVVQTTRNTNTAVTANSNAIYKIKYLITLNVWYTVINGAKINGSLIYVIFFFKNCISGDIN